LIGGWMDGAQLDVFVAYILSVRLGAWNWKWSIEALLRRSDIKNYRLLWKLCCSPSSSSAELHPYLKLTHPPIHVGSWMPWYLCFITIADNSTAVQLGLSYYSKVKSPASCMISVAPLMRSMLL
jgi:hypothetical protein